MQGLKVKNEGIAVADKLVGRNIALRGAIRALTKEHASTCAAAEAGREDMSRLQRAHDKLQEQVRTDVRAFLDGHPA